MRLTYKHLKNLEFPVFLLGSENWDYRDGILWLDELVLDDRNVEGKTLGERRLRTPFKDLYPIRKGVLTPLGIIKNKDNQTYIDNIGRLFTYEKTEFVKLRHLKIRKVSKKGNRSLLWLSNLNFPFEIPRPPPKGYTWASVLFVKDFPWMLYGYSEEKQKDTIRKI